MADVKDGKLELLSAANSCLVLVDYQTAMFKGVASGDKPRIRNAAICAAKAAKILDIPLIMSTINPQTKGVFMKEISDLFPGQEIFARKMPSFDAFEEESVLNAVRKAARKKIVISGLWTSMCFAYTSLHTAVPNRWHLLCWKDTSLSMSGASSTGAGSWSSITTVGQALKAKIFVMQANLKITPMRSSSER